MKKLQEKIKLMEGYLNTIDEILNELDIEIETKYNESQNLSLFNEERTKIENLSIDYNLASIDFIDEVILPIAEIIDEVKIQAGLE